MSAPRVALPSDGYSCVAGRSISQQYLWIQPAIFSLKMSPSFDIINKSSLINYYYYYYQIKHGEHDLCQGITVKQKMLSSLLLLSAPTAKIPILIMCFRQCLSILQRNITERNTSLTLPPNIKRDNAQKTTLGVRSLNLAYIHIMWEPTKEGCQNVTSEGLF